MKEGARIVSSRAFCSLNFHISDRNLSGENLSLLFVFRFYMIIITIVSGMQHLDCISPNVVSCVEAAMATAMSFLFHVLTGSEVLNAAEPYENILKVYMLLMISCMCIDVTEQRQCCD